jgi:hypothetical protein
VSGAPPSSTPSAPSNLTDEKRGLPSGQSMTRPQWFVLTVWLVVIAVTAAVPPWIQESRLSGPVRQVIQAPGFVATLASTSTP